ncbi:hypothetical protein [Marinobacter salarius]|uniref:Uncharacterized protein n=1 Tax=Marinobacter salarius TaxID=1420917 RepID=A0A1W6KFG8_9GAMM|nr:hypothetical protein [Marinobacter salarius]ARM86174.1 hypothetical protein MARSALSMR5_04154 [Marinobacter salarius]
MIEQIDGNTFKTASKNGRNTMTLFRTNDGWEVWTHNASTRAWNNGMPSVKSFDSLAQIEQKYRSFQGVSMLIEDHQIQKAG